MKSFGVMVFNAHQAFAEKWRETHSGDEACPQLTIVKLFDKYCEEFCDDIFHTKSKKIIPESEYSEEDQKRVKAARALQKQYHEEENIFVIDYLLENGANWEDIYDYCNKNKLVKLLERRAHSCDAADHQCSMFCEYFTEKGCAKNDYPEGKRNQED